MQLTALNRYPVKSCRGEALTRARVEPWGLAGDRRWLVTDEDGLQRTAREHPRMLLTRTEQRPDGGLRLDHPDAGSLEVDVPPPDPSRTVRVWSSEIAATPAGAAADAWFSEIIGRPSRLAYLDDPTRRRTNPRFSRPQDRVSFADGFPVLLATESSLAALNELIAQGPRAAEGPIAMVRFRPNVVVAGSRPWEEDGWRRLRIGAAQFRVVKGCARCAIPLTDADTAVRGKEPIATLARHRRFAGATWFAMNLVPDNPGAEIAVGDPVEILASEPAPDGPPR